MLQSSSCLCDDLCIQAHNSTALATCVTLVDAAHPQLCTHAPTCSDFMIVKKLLHDNALLCIEALALQPHVLHSGCQLIWYEVCMQGNMLSTQHGMCEADSNVYATLTHQERTSIQPAKHLLSFCICRNLKAIICPAVHMQKLLSTQ